MKKNRKKNMSNTMSIYNRIAYSNSMLFDALSQHRKYIIHASTVHSFKPFNTSAAGKGMTKLPSQYRREGRRNGESS